MKNRWTTTLLALLIMLIFATACASGTPTTSPASTTALDGATLIQERCSVCHPVSRVEGSRHTAADWKLIVDTMISKGAQLTPEEETVVVNYLSTQFGQ
jgi:cytochrome c-type biogenesis protein CcmH/NrfF